MLQTKGEMEGRGRSVVNSADCGVDVDQRYPTYTGIREEVNPRILELIWLWSRCLPFDTRCDSAYLARSSDWSNTNRERTLDGVWTD